MKRLKLNKFIKTLPIYGDINLLEFTKLNNINPVLRKQGSEIEILLRKNNKDQKKLDKYMKLFKSAKPKKYSNCKMRLFDISQ